MNKLWVVITETYKKNVKSSSFLIMILVPCMLIGILYFIGNYLNSQDGTVSNIAVISKDNNLRNTFIYKQNIFSVEKKIDSINKAKTELKNKKIDGYIILSNNKNQLSGVLYSISPLSNMDNMKYTQTINKIQTDIKTNELGLSTQEISNLNKQANFANINVKFNKDGSMRIIKNDSNYLMMIAIVIDILMFFIIMAYAQNIAEEIASEKGSRIMEVLLSSTTAQTQFFGKLIGVFLVCLTQIGIYVISIKIAFPYIKDSKYMTELLNIMPLKVITQNLLSYNMLYFLFGVLIYSSLAALCGSLVSKMEDVTKSAAPITQIAMIGVVLGIVFGITDPSNNGLKLFSFIPFLSSFTMPVRLAYKTVETSEVLLSLGLLIISTILLIALSVKIYKKSVLVYSDEGMLSSIKRSLSIMKNQK